MSLEDLGNLGEFVAAAAVVVSLIYLALQIRQNTDSLREAARRSTQDTIYRLNLLFVENPEVAALAMRGAAEAESLDPLKISRLHMLFMTTFLHYQDVYHRSQRSLIEPHLWDVQESHMLRFLQQKGLSAWWDRNKRSLSSDFAQYVDSNRQTRA